jgi:tetratricopeptide (TPR) repeat protein
MRFGLSAIVLSAPLVLAAPAHAESARDLLLSAAFFAPDKATALARIAQALSAADAALKRNPGDADARLQRGLAISYRGKLNRSRGDVMAALQDFDAAAAADPRNAEAQMAIAGWNLGAVIELGPFAARTLLGARTARGLAATERSLALAGDRAAMPALASLHAIQIDPTDVAGATRLAEIAVRARADTQLDRVLQKQAAILLPTLRKGNGKTAAAVAKQLMPFGRRKS